MGSRRQNQGHSLGDKDQCKDIAWVADGKNMDIAWVADGKNMDIAWVADGKNMDIAWVA